MSWQKLMFYGGFSCRSHANHMVNNWWLDRKRTALISAISSKHKQNTPNFLSKTVTVAIHSFKNPCFFMLRLQKTHTHYDIVSCCVKYTRGNWYLCSQNVMPFPTTHLKKLTLHCWPVSLTVAEMSLHMWLSHVHYTPSCELKCFLFTYLRFKCSQLEMNLSLSLSLFPPPHTHTQKHMWSHTQSLHTMKYYCFYKQPFIL